jgi:hypothetical protein
MMRWLLVLMVLLTAGVIAAQEETGDIRACTQAEIDALISEIESMVEMQSEAGSDDLGAFLSADTVAAAFGDARLAPCRQVSALHTRMSVMLNQSVIVAALVLVESYQTELGDSAAMMREFGVARADTLLYAIGTAMNFDDGVLTAGGEDWLECTEAQLNEEAVSALEDIEAEYHALVVEVQGDLLAKMMDYIELSLQYWGEIYPELPSCPMLAERGFTLGQLIDEKLLVTMLDWMAAMETDPDIAQTYSEISELHTKLLSTQVEAYFDETE